MHWLMVVERGAIRGGLKYIDASGGFYSWLFVPERGGNRSTKPYLSTYLTSLSMAWRESWFCATT